MKFKIPFIDYLLIISIWLLIFGKKCLSNFMLVDYIPSTHLDIKFNLLNTGYTHIFSLFDLFKIILAPFSLFNLMFTLSILISMLVSYFYIRRTFKEKGLIFCLLFAFIYFFNPFVYSRIMIGQLSVLISYILMPVFIFYVYEFLKNPDSKQLIKLVISMTLVSLFSIHFFLLNFIILIVVLFWSYISNDKTPYSNTPSLIKSIKLIIIFLILLTLLNSFWLQGFFSIKILSTIDSSHEEFFSPRMSENIPAIAKISGMWGFWRESSYFTTYNSLPIYVWYSMLLMLLLLMITSYFSSNSDNKSKTFFTLFWVGMLLGAGISHPYTKPFFDFLFNYLPLFNGLRDSHKLVSFVCLAYAYFIPLLVVNIKNNLKSNVKQQSKANSSSILLILLIISVIVFFLTYTYPLINLHNQLQPLSYPKSYNQIDSYLNSQNVNGYVVYLPWQTYLTYSWTIGSSSDGRISVPARVFQDHVIGGPDKYGAEDEISLQISSCINQKSVQCFEKANVQYILKDKCAIYPDKYEFLNQTPLYQSDCIDVYKLNNENKIEYSMPLRFIIGVLISIITLIVMVYLLVRKR